MKTFTSAKHAIEYARLERLIEQREPHFRIETVSKTGNVLVEYVFVFALLSCFNGCISVVCLSPKESAEILQQIKEAWYIYDACLANID